MIAWGRANFVQYPWRSPGRDRWLGLVAEVLLQRTRVDQVVPVYEEFARRYPSPTLLLREKPDALRQVVGSLGLHWRTPLLMRMASDVAMLGAPPDRIEELTDLPGVGPYAAAAYLSFHRGVRAPIVDSNVVRWLGRVFDFPTDPETRRKRWLIELADALTPARAFRAYNYAVLDLSMTICSATPHCTKCPLANGLCTFRAAQAGPKRSRMQRKNA